MSPTCTADPQFRFEGPHPRLITTAEPRHPPPKGFSDIGYVSGLAGQEFREVMGPGDCCAADAPPRPPQQQPAPPPATTAPGGGATAGLNVQGLPMVKPPYGVLSAINLDRGELMWQVAHGDTPDNVRNHPALKGLNIPKTGQAGTQGVGLMVTKTIVVMGDPQVTTTPDHPRGAMLRAYDKATGKARCGMAAGAAERIPDDVHGRWQTGHHRRRERRQLLG